MVDSPLQLDNPFWRFSVRVYTAPQVSTECLLLQQTLAIDVNVLLYCAWIGTSRRVLLTAADLEAIEALVSSWQVQIVRSLRQLRQQLKAWPAIQADELRKRVKDIELHAEQIEQALLFSHAEREWAHARTGLLRSAVQANMQLYLEHDRGMRGSIEFHHPYLTEAILMYESQL